MNERIKELRKTLGLTQQDFADKLKISRNSIASYETGKSNMGDAVINLICREFNVNETWLRTGDGEMFIPVTRDDEIADFMAELLKGEDDTFRRRLVSMLARLSEDEWVMIEKKAKELLEER